MLCLLVYFCLDSMKQRLEPIFKAAFITSKRSRKCWGEKRMWTWFYIQKHVSGLGFFGKGRSKKVYCKDSITQCLCRWAWQNKIHIFSYILEIFFKKIEYLKLFPTLVFSPTSNIKCKPISDIWSILSIGLLYTQRDLLLCNQAPEEKRCPFIHKGWL